MLRFEQLSVNSIPGWFVAAGIALVPLFGFVVLPMVTPATPEAGTQLLSSGLRAYVGSLIVMWAGVMSVHLLTEAELYRLARLLLSSRSKA